jgi:hypothetical protein
MKFLKFKDDPAARVIFGIFFLIVQFMGGVFINFSNAEAAGRSSWNIFVIVLCVWLIVSGIKIARKRKSLSQEVTK